MIVDGVIVMAENGITEEEIISIVGEEKKLWQQRGKELAAVSLTLDGEEIVVHSEPKPNIKRIRRITGYLSTVDRFNDAKKAELMRRVSHL